MCRREEHNVAIFLQRGAKPDQYLCRGIPFLPHLVHRRNLPIVRLLLEAGANVEVRAPARRETSLMRAVKRNDLEMVALLLQHGARVDTRDSLGVAPLAYAAVSGYTEITRLLIEHGANPISRCPDGNTAEDYARKYRHTEIVEMCRDYRKRALLKLRATPSPRPFISLEFGTAFLGGAFIVGLVQYVRNTGQWGHIVLCVIAGNLFYLQLMQIIRKRKNRRSSSHPEIEEQ